VIFMASLHTCRSDAELPSESITPSLPGRRKGAGKGARYGEHAAPRHLAHSAARHVANTRPRTRSLPDRNRPYQIGVVLPARDVVRADEVLIGDIVGVEENSVGPELAKAVPSRGKESVGVL
jgi:hypothetical protein